MDSERENLESTAAAVAAEFDFAVDDASLETALEYADELGATFSGPRDTADRGRPAAGSRSADDLNAMLYVYDTARTRETAGPLQGLDLAVKDNILARDLPLTCGVRDLAFVPSTDATVVDRLLDAGGTVVGKANMDAFAVGPAGQWSEFGTVVNPIDADRVPGGSSSGSGAAVAGGLVDAALGTDSGGSVRSPAACCGIVGMKPTHGLVPRDGLVDLVPSTDVIGPLARDVATARDVFRAIAGPAAADPSSTGPGTRAPSDGPYRIGIVENTVDAAESDVADRVRAAASRLDERSDHAVEAVTVDFGDVDAAFSVVIGAEFAWLCRQRFGIRGQGTGYDHELRAALSDVTFNAHIAERMLPGAILDDVTDGAAYVDARRTAIAFTERLAATFERVDVLLTPTLRSVPPKHGAVESAKEGLEYAFAKPFSLAPGPAVTVPVAAVGDLPVSAQLVGPPSADETVLDVAADLESFRE